MRVLAAMSGGVDSSVAAAMLADEGHDVVGVTLKLWGGESDSGCCSVADVEDARRVAAQLDIDHYVFNLTDEFAAAVVEPYVHAYAEGRTPNPCIECNRSIKFARLLERAGALGFDAVATGHHARVVREDSVFELRRGVDPAKDQSYVLYMLTQRELARVLLPIGAMTKREVREHAARLGLRTATKAESMDVCFVMRHSRVEFVSSRAATPPGRIVDTTGSVVGEHDGVAAFTVGQRRGVGVATGQRHYVVDLDAASATVTIGTRDDLARRHVDLDDLVFTNHPPRDGIAIYAQVRAHGDPIEARLRGARVEFDAPQPRVAPGQVVALYSYDVVLGGGIAA